MAIKNYEIREGLRCQVFWGAESCEELLKAILTWWETLTEDTKNISSITFNIDADAEGGWQAHVDWVFLTPAQRQKLDAILLTPCALPTPEIESPN